MKEKNMIEENDLIFSGPSAVPEGNVKRAVIFMHGYGANGHDLYGLSSFLKWSFPDTAFYFPNAPESVPGAELFGGRQWFELSFYNPALLKTRQNIEETCRKMLPLAEKARTLTDTYVTQVRERHGLTAEQTALVGFSQGGLMALYTSLRYPERLAAVVGLSAVAVTFDDKTFSEKDIVHKLPVTLVHGDADDVVPLQTYQISMANLEKAGVPVEGFVVSDLMHGIDETAMFHLKTALRLGFNLD